MAASPREISEAIAEVVQSATGLRMFAHPPQGASPPFGFVEFDEWILGTFGRNGYKEYTFQVRLVFPNTARDKDGYWMMVDALGDASDKSVSRAIFDAQTTDGFDGLAGVSVTCRNGRADGTDQFDGLDQYSGSLPLDVVTRGVA